jgi:hypothetical protein
MELPPGLVQGVNFFTLHPLVNLTPVATAQVDSGRAGWITNKSVEPPMTFDVPVVGAIPEAFCLGLVFVEWDGWMRCWHQIKR